MSASNKHTSKGAATAASKTMTDGRTAMESKSAAGSALSQAAKSTQHNAAEVLDSKDTGAKSKTAAGSALSQVKSKK